jgi:hypothetical protein
MVIVTLRPSMVPPRNVATGVDDVYAAQQLEQQREAALTAQNAQRDQAVHAAARGRWQSALELLHSARKRAHTSWAHSSLQAQLEAAKVRRGPITRPPPAIEPPFALPCR